jgi:protein gp37
VDADAMSENTGIEWCDSTFNPWIGCTKVSPGCDHCYAARQDAHRRWTTEGWGGPRKRTKTWGDPVKWNAAHEAFFAAHGRRQRVFCASLADWLDNQVPIDWLVDLLDLWRRTPNLDKLALTKRIGNWRGRLKAALDWMSVAPAGYADLIDYVQDWLDGHAPPDVWIGATMVNQPEVDRDVVKLLAVPARVRFLSIEPMLGPVDIRFAFSDAGVIRCPRCMFGTNILDHAPCPNDGETLRNDPGIDWVICGGESGPGARPMHPDWARSLRDQCVAAGVPFLFKQWGEWHPESSANYGTGPNTYRYGKVEGLSMLPTGAVCLRNTADAPAGQATVVDREAMQAWHNRCRLAEGKPDAENYPFGYQWLHRIGKKAAGRLLDGRTHDEFPGGQR